MNVLFLGGGRRVELAKRFINAGFRVCGYELSEQVPLASVAAIIPGLSWEHNNIQSHLTDVMRKNSIDIVLPLDCRAVAMAAEWNGFVGSRAIVVSDLGTASICLDKSKFRKHCLRQCSFLYPEPRIGHPYVQKPEMGFGGRGIAFFDDPYGADANQIPYHRIGCVTQNRLFGKEYTIDAYYDVNHNRVGTVARERLRVAGGEVLESVVVNRMKFEYAIASIEKNLRFRGPVCFQFKEDQPNGIPFVMEVNARFGGGSTLSMAAGLDMVDYLKTEYVEGKSLSRKQTNPEINMGLYMTRSYTDHFFNETTSI